MTGIASLEHRVRHSEWSKRCMLRFLTELQASVTEASATLNGQGIPLDELDLTDSDSESSLVDACDERTELEQIVQDLAEIVTGLFDLTRSVSYDSSRQLMIKASNVDMADFKPGDRRDVQLQLPGQIFKYLQEHRAPTRETEQTGSIQSVAHLDGPQSTPQGDPSDRTAQLDELTSNEDFPLPEVPTQVLQGLPFTCSYCFEDVHVSTLESWKLHVTEDLKPYVCTYERCEYPLELFSNEHQWAQHEKLHRKTWTCPQCDNCCWSADSLRNHLLSEHDYMADDTTINLCESSATLLETMECPMCATPTSDFREHVAQHLWAVALNTLPLPQDPALSNADTESVNDSEADELDSQISDAAMLEPEQDLMEVEELEVKRSIPTRWERTMLERDHKLIEAEARLRGSFSAAAEYGDLTTVKALYEQNRNVFYFNDCLGRALTYASQTGAADVVGFLSKLKDVDPNFRISTLLLQTPLAAAALNGHATVVQVLLTEPAVEIEAQDFLNATPLSLAAAYGHLNVVQMLIDHGADIETINKYRITPLCQAARAGHLDVVRLLLHRGADLKVGTRRDPLSEAASRGHEAIVKSLLDAGADVNTADHDGVTPLHRSMRIGSEQIVVSLLDAGAHIDRADLGGRMPLHHSALHGHARITQTLMDYGADVNAVDRNGWQALQYAAVAGHTGTVRLLLRAKEGRIDPKPNVSRYFLAYLDKMGHTEIVDLLRRAKAGNLTKTASSTQALPQRMAAPIS
ncbi:hypothetical protein CKM354_000219700 [Cercospora kikuchii]|uniref:C2H2-type domain-containing protein n=1 Tax=Cercospora kikuchii TaxID=84275 RepID=A0A9P3CC10_9PEZI|nr:uncharacterized protein CKM354_000219700 [Cercospora kikuchii]GIZ38796.1 hypothetical protein CKM354_000219700 [Cercospora kikuchii]